MVPAVVLMVTGNIPRVAGRMVIMTSLAVASMGMMVKAAVDDGKMLK